MGLRSALLVAAGAVLAEGIRYLARRVRAARLAARAVAGGAETSPQISLRLRSLPPSTLYAGKHALAPLMKRAGMAVLSGGVPPGITFPLRAISVTVAADRPAAQAEENSLPAPSERVDMDTHSGHDRSVLPSPSNRPSAGLAAPETIDVHLSAAEVGLSQRYAPFAWDALKEWLDAHVRSLHAPPPSAGHRTCITAGSMSGMEMLASIYVNRGDVVLIEERSFMAAIDVFKSVGAVLIPIPVDTIGIIPEALELTCSSLRASGQQPKLLYTVPVGQNPTGSRLAPNRYLPIYRTAAAHGVLIVEDDAYFYLQHRADAPTQPVPGLRGLGPSFLSLDTQGIVLRLDTFSKLLAPGFRIGWLTAPRRYRLAKESLVVK
jgi:DNA-binding transcriptional MocR family regulator